MQSTVEICQTELHVLTCDILIILFKDMTRFNLKIPVNVTDVERRLTLKLPMERRMFFLGMLKPVDMRALM